MLAENFAGFGKRETFFPKTEKGIKRSLPRLVDDFHRLPTKKGQNVFHRASLARR